ncbi:hypothetical protein E2C01_099545 [Portunus trituberculatus]|uniref:Uncharacterized protein n=1 Tax=Portunus trituberculatus TaxID=210409 RepID=A0A5B7KB95_PORTR|nr:hypothetical protein [Portunus trituberculatus]
MLRGQEVDVQLRCVGKPVTWRYSELPTLANLLRGGGLRQLGRDNVMETAGSVPSGRRLGNWWPGRKPRQKFHNLIWGLK